MKIFIIDKTPKMTTLRTAICSLIAGSILLQSCASILGGARDITMVKNGSPSNAKIYYNGNFVGEAPHNIQVDKQCKKGQCYIEIKEDGYETGRIEITRKVSVGFTILDICTGGLWLIIDFATGNIYKPRPNKINYSLALKEGNKPQKKIEYDFKVGDRVRFKNENGKLTEGSITAINNTTAVVKYMRWRNYVVAGWTENIEIEISMNKLYKIEDKEKNIQAETEINTEKDIYKTTSEVNMRAGAGVNYSKIMAINKGASVELIEKVNSDWWKIKYNDEIGFISSKYLTE